MKLCYLCQTPKPITDFFKSPTTKDKLFTHCKTCYYLERSQKYQTPVNYKITAVEAKELLKILKRIEAVYEKSVTIATMIGVNKVEINRVKSIIKRFSKTSK